MKPEQQEKVMWIVIGILAVVVLYVLLFNQPAAAQAGSAASYMVGGC